MMKESSSGVSRQLSGTQTAPILAIAKKASMYSTLFISSSATRSPLPTPSSRSALAVRFERRFHSENVKRRSVSTSTKPSMSGDREARLVRISPTLSCMGSFSSGVREPIV